MVVKQEVEKTLEISTENTYKNFLSGIKKEFYFIIPFAFSASSQALQISCEEGSPHRAHAIGEVSIGIAGSFR